MPEPDADDENQKRDRQAEKRAVAKRRHIGGKTRDIPTTSEKLAQPTQEDHHGQRHKDRMGAGVSDRRPRHGTGSPAGDKCCKAGQQKCTRRRIHPAMGLQHPGCGKT
ncbi:hypothetical protein D3C86_1704370 [compost metagenome]